MNTNKPAKIIAILRIWEKIFPKTFSSSEPKILKLGIHKDLMNQIIFPKSIIRKCLAYYCQTKAYNQQHVTGAPRYDLKGEIVDHVTQTQADKVKESIEQKKARNSSRD